MDVSVLPERPSEPICSVRYSLVYSNSISCWPFNFLWEIDTQRMLYTFIILQYYMKTGKCKFGINCKFHHPKDIQISAVGQDAVSGEQNEAANKDGETATGDSKAAKTFVPFTPALLHNSKGLPIRPVGSCQDFIRKKI